MIPRIVVHGGAGFQRKNIARAVMGVRAAATVGAEILRSGGSALDAAIMDGSNLSAGAVAMIRHVRNPIRLARIVMEKTDHVLLAGEKAEELATAFSLPSANPVTAYKRRLLLELEKDSL